MNVLLLIAVMNTQVRPIEAISRTHSFSIVREEIYPGGTPSALALRHSSGLHLATLSSSELRADPTQSYRKFTDGMNGFEPDTEGIGNNLKALDDAPIGIMVPVELESSLMRFGGLWQGKKVQSIWATSGQAPTISVIGSCVRTDFLWQPVAGLDRSQELLSRDKSSFNSAVLAFARWHNSESTATIAFVDRGHLVAGRQMVTKVDKNQNVYVDMNELSRHRGWNFTVSLEPARADVRIGNDHIKIYPGADRIHINDELVTLPGTVPTQGYGVYLPLRLLQERGYLPSADRLQKNATPW